MDGLRAHLLERTLVSSQVRAVLDRVADMEPGVRTGISIGGKFARLNRLRAIPSSTRSSFRIFNATLVPSSAVGRQWNDWRVQALAGLASRRWEVLMAQHRLIDAGVLAEVVCRGGLLDAWTVNERAAIQSLQGLGVHGITTADPRLFLAP